MKSIIKRNQDSNNRTKLPEEILMRVGSCGKIQHTQRKKVIHLYTHRV